jgi:hypothetical protein
MIGRKNVDWLNAPNLLLFIFFMFTVEGIFGDCWILSSTINVMATINAWIDQMRMIAITWEYKLWECIVRMHLFPSEEVQQLFVLPHWQFFKVLKQEEIFFDVAKARRTPNQLRLAREKEWPIWHNCWNRGEKFSFSIDVYKSQNCQKEVLKTIKTSPNIIKYSKKPHGHIYSS